MTIYYRSNSKDITMEGFTRGSTYFPKVGSRGKAPVGSLGDNVPPETEANVKYLVANSMCDADRGEVD